MHNFSAVGKDYPTRRDWEDPGQPIYQPRCDRGRGRNCKGCPPFSPLLRSTCCKNRYLASNCSGSLDERISLELPWPHLLHIRFHTCDPDANSKLLKIWT